jgi:hypothetical protein
LFNQALFTAPLFFQVMSVTEEDRTNGPAPKLATEGPLAEKDQQGQAIERHRKLAEEALAKWRRLKQKIKDKFKK